jgi:hypothetical protein
MIEAAYVIIAFGFLYLGFRFVTKFREIASWKSDDVEEGRVSASSPRAIFRNSGSKSQEVNPVHSMASTNTRRSSTEPSAERVGAGGR